MLAIWLWQSSAWTQPQSWVNQVLLGLQTTISLAAAVFFWKICIARKRRKL